MLPPLVLSVMFNAVVYYGARFLMDNKYHYNLSNRLDEQIPFIPWMVVVYLGCYVFWILNYILGNAKKQIKHTIFAAKSALKKRKAIFSLCLLPNI